LAKGTGVLAAGDMLDHFRVLRMLGKGGMARVYLARDTKLGRKVALKVIRPGELDSKENKERFLFEARATASFNHPHIVTIFAVGEADGFPYVALEYLQGQSLRQRIDQEKPSVAEGLRYCLAIAEALAEAHAERILHRDLKPANVMLGRDGRLRVLDFGLARAITPSRFSVDPDSAAITLSGAFPEPVPGIDTDPAVRSHDFLKVEDVFESAHSKLWGTPAYMAPEQWRQGEITTAVDIWALGTILYELIAGHRPYEESYTPALAFVVGEEDPVPELAADVTPELKDLVHRCLTKEAEERPTAEEVAEELRYLLASGKRNVAGESPFRGLFPFDEGHSALFFGRDMEIEAFVERMRRQPLIPVLGTSGAGKSSFVMAGVIPRLREHGPTLALTMRPGADPFRVLAMRIVAAQENDDGQLSADLFAVTGNPWDTVVDPGQLTTSKKMDRLARRLTSSPPMLNLELSKLAAKRNATVLLFVDQLEELQTLVPKPAVRKAFMQAICAAADDAQLPVRVVFTLREEFLSRLAEGVGVREALSHINVLRNPGPTALHEIMARPVEALGYEFDDPALVDEMVEEVQGETSCLPLLQFAGQMLWDGRDRKRRLLLRSVYESMGGVAGALAQHADGVLAGLSAGDVNLARTMLLRLVTGEGTRRVLSRSAVLEGLESRAEDVLRKLTSARLITGRQSEEVEGEGDVEIVHESLTVTWRRLARWIEEGKEELSFLAEVGQAARLWDARGRRQSELWEGDALHEARHTLERCTTPIPAGVTQFLEAATNREKQQLLRVRGLVGVAIAALVVIALVLAFQKLAADEQRNMAQQQRAEALREGARAALGNGEVYEARAKLRMALETDVSPAARALWWQLRDDPLMWSKHFGANLRSAAFSPDGATLAVASRDGTVYLLDVKTRAVRALRGHQASVRSVAFTPDGQQLASGDTGGQILIWDLASGESIHAVDGTVSSIKSLQYSPDGEQLACSGPKIGAYLMDVTAGYAPLELPEVPPQGTTVRFSPDGKWLAVSTGDGTHIWDLSTRAKERVLHGHQNPQLGVSFSPDGVTLATASTDHTVRLWEVATWEPKAVLVGHTAGVYRVAFSPDGALLASGAIDKSVRLWDVATGQSVAVLEGHTASVQDVQFSPDGRHLASVGMNQELRLWNMGSGGREPVVGGHTDGVHGMSLSPDGATLATASRDLTVRLWDLASGQVIAVLEGHTGSVNDVSFSPDGTLLATASTDKSVRLWDAATGLERQILGRHTSIVYCVDFSPDGRLVVSGGSDKTLRLWDVETGQSMGEAGRHGKGILGVEFSPDGRRLVSAGFDNMVNLWDVASRSRVHALAGHTRGVVGATFSPDGETIASGAADGSVRLWDVAMGTQTKELGPFDGWVYWLAFSPDGQRLGIPVTDGSALLLDLDSGESMNLPGHTGEVNSMIFSPSGEIVFSAGDDGSVRAWDTETARLHWRAPLLMGSPPRLFSHRGWTNPDGSGLPSSPVTAWQLAVEKRAARAAIGGGRTLCLSAHDGRLEVWDMEGDERLTERAIPGLQQVAALPDACVARVDGTEGGDDRVLLYPRDGSEVVLSTTGAVTAVSVDGEQLLVAAGSEIITFDATGAPGRRLAAPAGVTAISHAAEEWLVLGFGNGNLELLPTGSASTAPRHSFEQVPSSAVQRILRGPEQTLIVGFASGMVGIWDLEDGSRLLKADLHGKVTGMLLEDHQLFAATELGQFLVWDLEDFYSEPCELVRDVWANVPVVWENGRAVVREPPADHECSLSSR